MEVERGNNTKLANFDKKKKQQNNGVTKDAMKNCVIYGK
jgi:hypothetical protein